MPMYFEEKNSIRYGKFGCFDPFPFIRAFFSTRIGGVSLPPFDRLNLGMTTEDERNHVLENRKRFFDTIEIPQSSVVIQKQVHEDRSAYVEAPESLDCTDAAYTDRPNVFLTVSAADCVPVLFADTEKRIVGVIHAGWKGTLKNIAGNTIEKIKKQFSIDGSNIIAVIGPSISAKNYEVSKELADQFDPQFVLKNGYVKPHLDLWQANVVQLKNADVGNIFVSGYCTFERQDLFFSHRGSVGKSGRMLGVIGIAD